MFKIYIFDIEKCINMLTTNTSFHYSSLSIFFTITVMRKLPKSTKITGKCKETSSNNKG